MNQVPALMESWRIARAVGWSSEKTRATLAAMGLAGRVGNKHEYLVAMEYLEGSMPHIYRLVVTKYLAGELNSRRGGARAKRQKQ